MNTIYTPEELAYIQELEHEYDNLQKLIVHRIDMSQNTGGIQQGKHRDVIAGLEQLRENCLTERYQVQTKEHPSFVA
jgi:hypothetical protein